MLIVTKETKHYTMRFDLDLHYEIYKIRNKEIKSETGSYLNMKLENHELIGKKIVDNHTGKIYNIQSVHKHYHAGWYIVLLIECNNSHSQLFWKNINCMEPIITDHIEENKYRYSLIETA